MSNVKCRKSQGFSLLEVLIVIGIIAILSVIGTGYYRGFFKNVELDLSAKTIISDLRQARAKAMAGEDGLKWGIHFINGASDSYELFSTAADYAAGAVKTTTFLQGTVIFTNPAEAAVLDIIFEKITGTTAASAVTISSEGDTKTITITSQGNVY